MLVAMSAEFSSVTEMLDGNSINLKIKWPSCSFVAEDCSGSSSELVPVRDPVFLLLVPFTPGFLVSFNWLPIGQDSCGPSVSSF